MAMQATWSRIESLLQREHGRVRWRKNFPIQTENHLVQWELVKAGLGIGFMPEDIGDAEARVKQVLPSLEPILFPIWLTSHRELKTSRRARLVFDLLADALA